jgi:3-mercaptopyruvate sulfurtransferase SseA
MRKFLLVTFSMAAIAFVVSCTDAAKPPVRVQNAAPAQKPATAQPPADAHQDDGHDAPRITLADAKKEYDAGTAVIIDVRDPSVYKQEHIKGALNIPPAEIAANINKIPKGKKIIAYCS